MLHTEGLGEVRAGGFALPGDALEVHLIGVHMHSVCCIGRHVLIAFGGGFDGQVVGCDREAGLEQSLVDGAELAHRQGSEIDGSESVSAVNYQ